MTTVTFLITQVNSKIKLTVTEVMKSLWLSKTYSAKNVELGAQFYARQKVS